MKRLNKVDILVVCNKMQLSLLCQLLLVDLLFSVIKHGPKQVLTGIVWRRAGGCGGNLSSGTKLLHQFFCLAVNLLSVNLDLNGLASRESISNSQYPLVLVMWLLCAAAALLLWVTF